MAADHILAIAEFLSDYTLTISERPLLRATAQSVFGVFSSSRWLTFQAAIQLICGLKVNLRPPLKWSHLDGHYNILLCLGRVNFSSFRLYRPACVPEAAANEDRIERARPVSSDISRRANFQNAPRQSDT